MNPYKLKVKIGQHEFEAEGPEEVVQSQFQAFQQLIATAQSQKQEVSSAVVQEQKPTENGAAIALDRIMRSEGRVVSLTALPGNHDDAAMLVLLGQKTFRNNDTVTGSEIMDGLELSGIRLPRVDRLMEKLAADGLVIKVGIGRASRYRLTNQGMSRAQSIARDVLAVVA